MEPKLLFERFAEICKVPRESGNELGMQRYLEAFAAAHGFASKADKTGNVVINVPPRGAGIGKESIVLQSHTDMVCVKSPGSTHDFTKDAIRTRVESREDKGVVQDVLIADNTTLGADNGLGVAAALAVATDPNIENCPPLELLFTVDEERGLTGASTLDPAMLSGRYLINMDSEELGDICISCAGGRDMTVEWPAGRHGVTEGRVPLTISLKGLPGGHSGVQINEGRGNAISFLVSELLSHLGGSGFGIASLSGGSKRNVIPSSAEITVWVDGLVIDRLDCYFTSELALKTISSSVLVGNDNISISTERNAPNVAQPISDESSSAILKAIIAIPWGPQKMSEMVAGLVETSNNVAVVSTTDSEITLCCSTRSSRVGAVATFQEVQKAKLEASGASVTFGDGYPGWEADPENPLLKQAESTFARVLGTAPKVSAVHAGLECGVIKGILPEMRMISFGPDILDAHTILERVLLKSVPPFYNCLAALLRDLCVPVK